MRNHVNHVALSAHIAFCVTSVIQKHVHRNVQVCFFATGSTQTGTIGAVSYKLNKFMSY